MKKRLPILAVLALAAGVVCAQTNDTLAKIKSSGSVTLGVREFSGLSFSLGHGKYGGFHTEMGERIIADLQQQLGLGKLDIKYQPVTSQNRIPLLQNGTVDLECGSTTNNTARQKDVSFAVTTYVEEVRIAVKGGLGIQSIQDLNGKTVAATAGTTSVQILREHERATGVDFKEVFGKDHTDSFLMLEVGRADAFVMDASILAASIAKSKHPAHFMLRKDDPAFKRAVDNSLRRQMADGSLARLYHKWFMQPIAPGHINLNMPPSEATRAAWANPNDRPMEDYARR